MRPIEVGNRIDWADVDTLERLADGVDDLSPIEFDNGPSSSKRMVGREVDPACAVIGQ
jgi:hypothetical protein